MIVIGNTSKGKRVWIQGLDSHGFSMPRYTVIYSENSIHILTGLEGKRKVCAQKGGIIDIVGKAVTQWAQDSTHATVVYGVDSITVTRV
jgi:hypothetical protein